MAEVEKLKITRFTAKSAFTTQLFEQWLERSGLQSGEFQSDAIAERQFLPVFDWAAAQSDLDGDRVGLLGRSFGGY